MFFILWNICNILLWRWAYLLLLLVDIILLCFNLLIFSLVINCMQRTVCMDRVQYYLSYTSEQREENQFGFKDFNFWEFLAFKGFFHYFVPNILCSLVIFGLQIVNLFWMLLISNLDKIDNWYHDKRTVNYVGIVFCFLLFIVTVDISTFISILVRTSDFYCNVTNNNNTQFSN